MTTNHLRPAPPVPLHTAQQVAERTGSVPVEYDDGGNVTRCVDVLIRTYDDGAETIAVKDRADRFARWTTETPLTQGVLL